MTPAAICFSTADSAHAEQLAAYLGLHTSLDCDLAVSRSPDAFLDVIEQCLFKEFVFVLLSAHSTPMLWPRSLWEPVLLDGVRDANTIVAYVCLNNCPFPPILRRRNFFDFSQNAAAASTALRRWAIDHLNPERSAPSLSIAAEPDESLLWLLDSPGLAQGVQSFAAAWLMRNHWQDFEGLYWINCAHRTPAGVLGELAHALGLRLPGTLDANWRALRQHAAQHRALYVFENIDQQPPDLGGKSSILVLQQQPPPERMPIPQVLQVFVSPLLNEKACLQAWSEINTGSDLPAPWPDILPLAWPALRLLKGQARLAEAHESLEWLASQAERHSDHRALELIRWEENWILDSWDLPPRERTEFTKTQPHQLWLPLPA